MTNMDDVYFSGIAQTNFVSQSAMTKMSSCPGVDFDKGPRRYIATKDMGSGARTEPKLAPRPVLGPLGTYARMTVDDVVLNVSAMHVQ